MKQFPIIVLGGSGYIGSNIALHLKKKQFDVTALSSKQCNLSTQAGCAYLEKLLRTPSRLIIASAITRTTADSLDSCIENIEQTKNIVNACLTTPPQSICFLSAADVYGDAGKLVNESATLAPLNPYGCYKAFSEHLFSSQLADVCPIDIIRFSGVFGGLNDTTSLLFRLCQRIINNQPIVLNNGGNIIRDFVPMPLMLEAIYNMVTAPKNKTLNVSTGEEITIKQLVQLLFKHLNCEPNITLKPNKTERDFNLSLSNKTLKATFPDIASYSLLNYIQLFAQHHAKT